MDDPSDLKGSLVRKEIYLIDQDAGVHYITDFEGNIKFQVTAYIAPLQTMDEKVLINWTDDEWLQFLVPEGNSYKKIDYPTYTNVTYDGHILDDGQTLVCVCDTMVRAMNIYTDETLYEIPFFAGLWAEARVFMRAKTEMVLLEGGLIAVRGFYNDFRLFNGYTGETLLELKDLDVEQWSFIGNNFVYVDEGKVYKVKISLLFNTFASTFSPEMTEKMTATEYIGLIG